MRLTRKNTTILQVVGIILVVVLTSILMFKPEIVPGLNEDTRSISSLMRKKDTVDDLNRQLESVDDNLSNIKGELNSIESELVSAEIESERLRKGIEDTNFAYHLPSIMVMLEQKAKELNLEFSLDYDRIQTLTGGESFDDMNELEEDLPLGDEIEDGTPDDLDEDLMDDEELEDNNDPQGGEDEEIEPNKESEGPKESENPEDSEDMEESDTNGRPNVDMSELTKDLPDISGINITSIPIEVKGSYGNIRLFIEYLDEIDLLEHNIVDLYSFGKDVSAIIAFNVYHTAEEDNNEEYDNMDDGFDELDDFDEQNDFDIEDEYLDEGIERGDDY